MRAAAVLHPSKPEGRGLETGAQAAFEIEDALRRDPRITDAAVVAVANAAGIDEIWAAIATSAPVEVAALRTLLRERLNEKTPDRLFAVEGIPRTESGKIMRYRVRELLIELQLAQPARLEAAQALRDISGASP